MAKKVNDRDDVLAANEAFYAAFESLDADRMQAVWLKESYITCTHPGWARLIGWGSVMQSWREIFSSTFGMKFVIADEMAHAIGDLGWVTCTEHIESRVYDGVSHATVIATNLFERRQGAWWLVHHHGSPLVRAADPSESQLQ